MEKELNQLGLNTNENKVFLALLELGPSHVTKISQKASINRTTAYDILQRLLEYGLIRKAAGEGAKQKYAAKSPDNLVRYLENQKNDYQNKIREIKEFLPQLQLLFKDKDRPAIKFYEGLEGLKEIYEETLKAKEEILSCLDVESWDTPELSEWGKNYNRQRAKLQIYERSLVLPTEKSIKWMTDYPATTKYTNYRFLPKDKFPLFNAEINIFEDKLVIALLKQPNPMGIMITSQSLVNILKAMFEMAWEQAEKYNKKTAS